MDNDDYCDDASNAEIERKEKMWLSCSERDRCIECEKSRRQGALEQKEILEAISLWCNRDRTAQEKHQSIINILEGKCKLKDIKKFVKKVGCE